MWNVLRCSIAVAIVMPLTLLGGAAKAEEATLLRWKFKPGESLHFVMTQDITQGMKMGDQPMQMKINQTMDMSMKVEAVDEKGTATIKQSIDRVRMTVKGPMAMEYDSAAEKEPEGMGKMLAQAFSAIVKKPFTVKMNTRGMVIDFKMPEGAQESMNKVAPGTGQLMSEESIKQMSEISVLPEEAIAPEKNWSRKAEMNMPQLGKLAIDSQFTFKGMETRDGKPLAKIAVEMRMKPTDVKGGMIKIVSYEGKGTLWFNNAEGRLEESDMKSTMKSEISVAGQSMSQDMQMAQGMKFTPAGAEKPKP